MEKFESIKLVLKNNVLKLIRTLQGDIDMKGFLFTLGAVCFMAGCANNGYAPMPVPDLNAPVTSVWTNTDPTSRIPALDLSVVPTGIVVDVTPLIDCVTLLNGQPDEAGNTPVNGVGFNQVLVTGNDQSGTIQFGPLSHTNHNLDNVCYTLGTELYNYTISGKTMTLIDPAYPQYVSTFVTQ